MLKVVLWRKSHISYLSHFETKTSSLHDKKNAVYYFQISLSFQRYSSFKTCKLGKWWHHTLSQILFKYDGKRCFSQFVSEMFDSLQYDSTNCAPRYELKSSVTMATYWVPVLPILKAFLATFDIPFWYLLTALHIHDPASI